MNLNLRSSPSREHPEQASHQAGEISSFCPRYQYAVELIGRRWVGAILRVLLGHPRRFNEIMAAIPGLSDRLLTERLRELETDGIARRTVHDERPVRVTYELTACGESLEPIIRGVGEWAEAWVQAHS
ncbi:MAG: winged helix-turn-helix transcriptional regulator [Vulcanimicrobiaceae bacterium]